MRQVLPETFWPKQNPSSKLPLCPSFLLRIRSRWQARAATMRTRHRLLRRPLRRPSTSRWASDLCDRRQRVRCEAADDVVFWWVAVADDVEGCQSIGCGENHTISGGLIIVDITNIITFWRGTIDWRLQPTVINDVKARCFRSVNRWAMKGSWIADSLLSVCLAIVLSHRGFMIEDIKRSSLSYFCASCLFSIDLSHSLLWWSST